MGKAAEHKGIDDPPKTLSGLSIPAHWSSRMILSGFLGSNHKKQMLHSAGFCPWHPAPWQDPKECWHPWSSWAAKLLPSLSQCQPEQPLSPNPPSFGSWILAAFSSTPPAPPWYSPILAEPGMWLCCTTNADEKWMQKSMALL